MGNSENTQCIMLHGPSGQGWIEKCRANWLFLSNGKKAWQAEKSDI